MDYKTIISIVLLCLIGYGAGRFTAPVEVIDRTNYQQERIDSLTSVIRARQATAESLRDSLSETSEAFQQYIDEHQGEIASLSTIRGRLNLRIDQLEDSLAASRVPIAFNPPDSLQVIPDTLIAHQQRFGNGLFEITSWNRFEADRFSDSLDVRQLRSVRIDQAILVSEDRRTIEAIVTSPDFTDLQVSAQTTIEPPNDRIHWTILVAAGIVAGQGLNIIF